MPIGPSQNQGLVQTHTMRQSERQRAYSCFSPPPPFPSSLLLTLIVANDTHSVVLGSLSGGQVAKCSRHKRPHQYVTRELASQLAGCGGRLICLWRLNFPLQCFPSVQRQGLAQTQLALLLPLLWLVDK